MSTRYWQEYLDHVDKQGSELYEQNDTLTETFKKHACVKCGQPRIEMVGVEKPKVEYYMCVRCEDLWARDTDNTG